MRASSRRHSTSPRAHAPGPRRSARSTFSPPSARDRLSPPARRRIEANRAAPAEFSHDNRASRPTGSTPPGGPRRAVFSSAAAVPAWAAQPMLEKVLHRPWSPRASPTAGEAGWAPMCEAYNRGTAPARHSDPARSTDRTTLSPGRTSARRVGPAVPLRSRTGGPAVVWGRGRARREFVTWTSSPPVLLAAPGDPPPGLSRRLGSTAIADGRNSRVGVSRPLQLTPPPHAPAECSTLRTAASDGVRPSRG